MVNNHLITLKVFLQPAAPKPVFVRELWLHPQITIPFNNITETMRFLFGSQCVVEFSSTLVDESLRV